MANNLLDYVGLGYFLSKIKTLFVTALGTSGNNLTWTKNGTTNNITVPYATKAELDVSGNIITTTYAPKNSPALTGTPTAPTATAETNTTQIATTAFVKNAVDSKVHYVANLQAGTAANYITSPEVKTIKINGSTTNSASTANCVLLYDTTNKCLKFIFN